MSAFWFSVPRNDGHYAAFLISFSVIAAAWGNHHDLFWYARRFDPRLRSLNTAWLLTIVLVLFATRMLTAAGRPVLDVHALRPGFHAMLQVGIGGAAGDAAAHGLARAGAWCAARGGDRPDPAVFMP